MSVRLLVVVGVAFPLGAAPQKVPTVSLGQPVARLEEEFSALLSIRELNDGRVLIVDAKDTRLVVADFATDQVRQIGRQGRGPGEDAMLSSIQALAGDSSLISTLDRRWLLLEGSRIVATMSPDAPAIAAARGNITGADHHGRLHDTHEPPQKSGVRKYDSRDSLHVLLIDRRTARIDTVAQLMTYRHTTEREVDADGNVVRLMITHSPPLAVGEHALLFPDGWLAIARLAPYRVDWRSPAGEWTRGAPVAVPAVRVDGREQHAFMARLAKQRNTPAVESPDTQSGWPEVVPPFQFMPLLPASDGQLVVRRTPTAAYPGTRYDVIDRRGVLTLQVVLRENEHIVGFGRRSVYVVETDDDGIQRLRRHAWPSPTPRGQTPNKEPDPWDRAHTGADQCVRSTRNTCFIVFPPTVIETR
jgi:hypothetical protein